MNSAPIALFVYNRLEHLIQTIEALKKNVLASESELFIFSDGPKKGGGEKVQCVRDYVKEIDGFRTVKIYESTDNKGLAYSIIDGVTRIVNKYGRVIVVEDDLVTSPYFLQYMNDALNIYENDEKVACVHGYNYPIEGLPETFFIRGADCWGWATWKRAWFFFEPSGKVLLAELKRRRLEASFDFGGHASYTKMLRDQIAKKNNSWAIRWYASAFLRDMLCLYPGKTLVRNIGFDEQGTHCRTPTECFDSELAQSRINVERLALTEEQKCRKKYEDYFKGLSGKKKHKRFIVREEKDGVTKIRIGGVLSLRFGKRKKYGFFGDYSSFSEALRKANGYAQSNILDATIQATLKVKVGEVAFERDSVTFDHVEYSFPMLAALQKVGIEFGFLNVLDFGGALGSHYFQNRTFLSPIRIKKWTVVEQPHYVEAGNLQIADGTLGFAYSIDDVKDANVLILSSVVQYLEEPYAWIQRLLEKNIEYVIVDRTAFNMELRDRLTLQVVSPSIYEASYPAWFLNKEKFLTCFLPTYDVMLEWDGFDVVNVPSMFKGFLFKLRHRSSRQ